MNLFMRQLAAASAVAALLAPVAGHAGTRASQTTRVTSAPATTKATSPKSGFPSTPGLVIANIKASDKAGFKSAGT